LTGAAIEIPLIAATVWLLARLGAGNPEAPLMHILRLTAVFAGVAALLTAGGIGRLAAYAFAEEPRGQPSEAAPGADLAARRRRAIGRAARAHAVAGAGLVIIAAIPQGHLPETTAGWLALPAAGLAYGALAGAIIGVVCTSQTSLVQLADVWSLAYPGAARDPRDAGCDLAIARVTFAGIPSGTGLAKDTVVLLTTSATNDREDSPAASRC